MNIERRYRNSRRLYLEYPHFTGGDDECILPNLFSEKLAEAVAGSSSLDPSRTYRLSFSEESIGEEVCIRYALRITEARKTVCRKEALIVWKDGFAIQYKKIANGG
ncbi:MAG: hypothetical protein IJT70_04485 [Clostridia bacterium]|nr:hypothetical protein [Clostridia bacterium]